MTIRAQGKYNSVTRDDDDERNLQLSDLTALSLDVLVAECRSKVIAHGTAYDADFAKTLLTTININMQKN